jgi:hypothetical protein
MSVSIFDAPNWLAAAISAVFGGGGMASWFVLRRKTLDAIVDAKLRMVLDEYQKLHEECQQDRDRMRQEIVSMRRFMQTCLGCPKSDTMDFQHDENTK